MWACFVVHYSRMLSPRSTVSESVRQCYGHNTGMFFVGRSSMQRSSRTTRTATEMTFVSVNRRQSLRSLRVNSVCSTISSPGLHRPLIRGLVPRRRSPVRNIRFCISKTLIQVANLSLWCCMLGCCQHNHSSAVHRIAGPLKLGWSL